MENLVRAVFIIVIIAVVMIMGVNNVILTRELLEFEITRNSVRCSQAPKNSASLLLVFFTLFGDYGLTKLIVFSFPDSW